ncbi:MAG TPA: hypothetical protein VFB80_03105 [Pirellulaceae bacterium]|nr:hypothetical protein [Pirellulaceae bacterium]
MPSQPSAAITAAASRCLAKLSLGDAPLLALAECLGELRELGWDQDSVNAVDFAVRQVLKELVHAEEGPTFA